MLITIQISLELSNLLKCKTIVYLLLYVIKRMAYLVEFSPLCVSEFESKYKFRLTLNTIGLLFDIVHCSLKWINVTTGCISRCNATDNTTTNILEKFANFLSKYDGNSTKSEVMYYPMLIVNKITLLEMHNSHTLLNAREYGLKKDFILLNSVELDGSSTSI
ncbi:uncharacterized protein SCDLUD_002502 [Saccharomycodes ludwigii]|uniref:uncharacterized protein n=1 Tax=Saccharomycodes ludwigii TaxID=36035 RepID=UPI001E8C4E23|nr:hypothetical protein SCDLUD_002502 [Saccharomycodes ludwigii]KAH3901032.1 hypothetical protein SCDLUD_002502 [Saccharomycodes ludwigii]